MIPITYYLLSHCLTCLERKCGLSYKNKLAVFFQVISSGDIQSGTAILFLEKCLHLHAKWNVNMSSHLSLLWFQGLPAKGQFVAAVASGVPVVKLCMLK